MEADNKNQNKYPLASLKKSVVEIDTWTQAYRKQIRAYEEQKLSTLDKVEQSLIENTKVLNEIAISQHELKDCSESIENIQFKLKLKLEKLLKLQEEMNLANKELFITPAKSNVDKDAQLHCTDSDLNSCNILDLQLKTIESKIATFTTRIKNSLESDNKQSSESLLKSMLETLNDSFCKLNKRSNKIDETINKTQDKMKGTKGQLEEVESERFLLSQGTNIEVIGAAVVVITFLILSFIQF